MFLKNILINESNKPSPKEVKNYLYGKVCFRSENYIANSYLNSKEKFDVILCFSTVKYIHLNFGDLGVKTLFLKAFDQLTVGGFFILEAQLWKSYKKKKSMSSRTKENFNNIKLRPHLFKTYL